MRFNSFCGQFFILDWKEGCVRESNSFSLIRSAVKLPGERLVFMNASLDHVIFVHFCPKQARSRISISFASKDFEHFIEGFVVFTGILAGVWWSITADGNFYAFSSDLSRSPSSIGKIAGGICCLGTNFGSSSGVSNQILALAINKTFRFCSLDSSTSLCQMFSGSISEMHPNEAILKIDSIQGTGIVAFFVGLASEGRINRVLVHLLDEEMTRLDFLAAYEAPKGFQFVCMTGCKANCLILLATSPQESQIITVNPIGGENQEEVVALVENRLKKTSFPVVIHDISVVPSSEELLIRILVGGTSTEYFGKAVSSVQKPREANEEPKKSKKAKIHSLQSNQLTNIKENIHSVQPKSIHPFLAKIIALKHTQEIVHKCISFYLHLLDPSQSSSCSLESSSLGANYKALVKGYFLLDHCDSLEEAFAHLCSPHIVADWEIDILKVFIQAGRSDLAYCYYIYSGRISFENHEERRLFLKMLIDTDNSIEAFLQARLWKMHVEFLEILSEEKEKLIAFLETCTLLQADESKSLIIHILQGDSTLISKGFQFFLRIGDLESARALAHRSNSSLGVLFRQVEMHLPIQQNLIKLKVSDSGCEEIVESQAIEEDYAPSISGIGMLSTPKAPSKQHQGDRISPISHEVQMPQYFTPRKSLPCEAFSSSESSVVAVAEEHLPLYRIDPSGKNKPAISSTLAFNLMEDSSPQKETENMKDEREESIEDSEKTTQNPLKQQENESISLQESLDSGDKKTHEDSVNLSSAEIENSISNNELNEDSKEETSQVSQLPSSENSSSSIQEQASCSTEEIKNIPSKDSSVQFQPSISNEQKKPKKNRRKRSLIQSPILASSSSQISLLKVKPNLPNDADTAASKKLKNPTKEPQQEQFHTPKSNTKSQFSTPMSTRGRKNK